MSKFDFNNIAKMYDSWYDTPAGKKIDFQEKDAFQKALPKAETHKNILEVGCGTGHWSEWFSSLGYNVTGIDISEKMIEEAKRKNISSSTFLRDDFLSFSSEKKYDITAAITSLEFMDDYESAIEKMASMTRKGGYIITGVLNRYSYMGFGRTIKGKKDPVFSDAHFFSYNELYKLMRRHGKAGIIGSTFTIPIDILLPAADIFEFFGTILFPFCGNFLVGYAEI